MNLPFFRDSLPDERVRRYVLPDRILLAEGGVDRPETLLAAGSGQPTIWSVSRATFPPGSGILLDFGRELHGGVQIITGRTPDDRPARFRLRFGESVAEACGSPDNCHAIHDTELDLAPMGANEFGNTAFRFLRLDNRSPFAIELREIRAILLFRDLPWRGGFESDDPVLDEVWRTGAYTVQLCMQDYVWDGAKRDRLVWMGDMHPELLAVSAVFGRVPLVEASMDLARDEAALPRCMNNFVSYSLWWIVCQYDWFLFHGNREYLERQRGYLTGLLRQLIPMIGGDGAERLFCTERLLDWPNYGNERAIHAGHQGLFALALRRGGELCAELGETDCAGECGRALALLRRYTPPECGEKSPNALLVLGGLADPVRCNREKLAVDPLRNLSTFHGCYVLEARAMAGDYAGALRLIRDYWGEMLRLGATTFWEHFDAAWSRNAGRIDELPQPGRTELHATCGENCYTGTRNSFCHGWSAGPTAWLSRHVLGIRILEPGARRVEIAPHLPGLRRVRGTFPTPYGEIRVEHEKTGSGEIRSRVELPPGVESLAPQAR